MFGWALDCAELPRGPQEDRVRVPRPLSEDLADADVGGVPVLLSVSAASDSVRGICRRPLRVDNKAAIGFQCDAQHRSHRLTTLNSCAGGHGPGVSRKRTGTAR